MAIGLGRMFGFRFLENFNYPYISQTIQEFWRRWHISLSRWFRDYLYIPLGGSRVKPWRVYFNLVTFFFLCGLWHGASRNFVIWGMVHGVCLVVERLGLDRALRRVWPPIRHIYVLAVVMFGWVLFRAETLRDAMAYFRALAGFSEAPYSGYEFFTLLDHQLVIILFAAFIAATPILPLTRQLLTTVPKRTNFPSVALSWYRVAVDSAVWIYLMALATLSAMALATGTYNPFIYFRF